MRGWGGRASIPIYFFTKGGGGGGYVRAGWISCLAIFEHANKFIFTHHRDAV